MLQPNLATSPAMLAMLAACVLGIGFMVRFFVALAGEEWRDTSKASRCRTLLEIR